MYWTYRYFKVCVICALDWIEALWVWEFLIDLLVNHSFVNVCKFGIYNP